jgi:hypothetical protein
VHC